MYLIDLYDDFLMERYTNDILTSKTCISISR